MPLSKETKPNQRVAHLVVFKIFVGRDLQKLDRTTQRQKTQLCHFKILKFSGPSLLGMTSSILQLQFLSGGLLWQMVIVISFPRERKTIHLD